MQRICGFRWRRQPFAKHRRNERFDSICHILLAKIVDRGPRCQKGLCKRADGFDVCRRHCLCDGCVSGRKEVTAPLRVTSSPPIRLLSKIQDYGNVGQCPPDLLLLPRKEPPCTRPKSCRQILERHRSRAIQSASVGSSDTLIGIAALQPTFRASAS